MNISSLVRSIALVSVLQAHAFAHAYTIDPAQNGTLSYCEFCALYVETSGISSGPFQEGLVRFHTPTGLSIDDKIELSLAPVALPLRGPVQYVYGYESSSLDVTTSDLHAGSFLGAIVIPSNADFRNTFELDVSDFVKSASSPYITFNLRSDERNSFTSTMGYSFQRPTQLWVTSVPESSSLLQFGIGLTGLGLAAFLKRTTKQGKQSGR